MAALGERLKAARNRAPYQSNGHPAALKEALDKLDGVKQRGSHQWQAICPCHDDTDPSLSISVGKDRRVLLFCHACCEFEDIVAALDMNPADFAPGGASNPLREKLESADEELKRLSALEEEEDEVLMAVAKRAIQQVGQDVSSPLPFPVDVFPEGMRRFVRDHAECLPCPPDYIAVPALVVVGSFIGVNRPIEVKRGWQERANVTAMNVGRTGSRKTPSLEAALSPARKRDRQLKAEYDTKRKEYVAKEREAKQKKKDFDERPPVAQQHIATDTTVEAVAELVIANPRGVLVYRDEAVGFVTSLNQYKGGCGSDRQFWLSAWSCQDYTINRKGKDPLRVERPYLPIIGNIPPDMLGELADRRGREDGFIDRILFGFPDSVEVKWVDRVADQQAIKDYEDACFKIGQLKPAVLKLNRLASATFAAWFNEHNRQNDGPPGSWAKMDGYCARLANIVHHLRWAFGELKSLSALEEVDAESVARAIRLIDYFKNSARRALGCMNAAKEKNPLARLLSYVSNAPDRRVYPRNLIAAQIAPNATAAKAMLEELASLGLGTMKKGNRKDSVYFQGNDNPTEPTADE